MKKEYIPLPVYDICSGSQPAQTLMIDKLLLNSVFHQLLSSGDGKECGGAFGWYRKDSNCIIEVFSLDNEAETGICAFKPSAPLLKHIRTWESDGFGFIHTHREMRFLSPGDFEYLNAFFEANPGLQQLISGVFTTTDRQLHLYFFERTAFMDWYQTTASSYLHCISDALCPPVSGGCRI